MSTVLPDPAPAGAAPSAVPLLAQPLASGASTATALRELSAEPVHAARAVHLRQLAAALDGAPTASAWAELDLVRVLDVDGPLVGVREESVAAQRLEMLRTVLVFCPLLVTWLGLFLAGRAYAALTAVDPSTQQLPFLKLWLSGFEGHTWLTLDRVAVTTVALVAVLIAVSVALERRREADETAFLAVAQEHRLRLRAAVTSAQLVLHEHRLANPERFRAEITRTSAAFTTVVQQVQALSDAADRSLTGLNGVAEQIGATSERSREGAEALAAASHELTGTVAALEQAVARVGSDVSGAVRESSVNVSEAVETSSGWVVGAAEALLRQSDQALARSEQTFDRVGRAVGDVQARVEALREREDATAELLAATRTVVEHAVPLRDAVGQLQLAVRELAAAGGSGHQPLLTAAQHLDAAARRLVQLAPAAPSQPVARPVPAPPAAPAAPSGAAVPPAVPLQPGATGARPTPAPQPAPPHAPPPSGSSL